MPPAASHKPDTDTDHLLAQGHQHGAGPMIGVIIIVVVLALGGLYFWGAQLNREPEPLPFIPGDSTSTE